MAFPRGKVIVPIGERFRGVYHIIKGKASIQLNTDDVVAEIQEGSVFGKVPTPAWHASMAFILMR
jgi:ribose/xylose/arabinose/galactoside ABC-type transport system permease subunit